MIPQKELEDNWKTAVDKWNQENTTNLNSEDFIVDVCHDQNYNLYFNL